MWKDMKTREDNGVWLGRPAVPTSDGSSQQYVCAAHTRVAYDHICAKQDRHSSASALDLLVAGDSKSLCSLFPKCER